MAIDLSTLSEKIQVRLNKKTPRFSGTVALNKPDDTRRDMLLSSIRAAVSPSQNSQPKGLVRSVLKAAPGAIAGGVGNYLKNEDEKRRVMSLGQRATYDIVEKPARILKAASVDLPRMMLGGLSSVGKSVLESVYSPVFGKEQVRTALNGSEESRAVERALFTSETKSWQNIKEDVDTYTANSNVATDWEKKNLGLTLAVAGFTADAWIGGGGKSKIAGKVLKQLAEEGDEIAVREILGTTNIPRELAEAASPGVARAKTPQEVQKAVTDAAQTLLRQTDEAQPVVAQAADPLVVEARKYGSAEEFVGSQQQVFRGGTKFDPSKMNAEGTPFTLDNKVAEQFARAKNQFDAGPVGQALGKSPGQNITEKFYVSSNAKIATRADIPDDIFNTYKQANPLTKPDVAEPIVNNWAKANGFDGIDYRTLGKTSTKEAEIKILNPDVLKTKSQLTDLYNTAKATPQSVAILKQRLEEAEINLSVLSDVVADHPGKGLGRLVKNTQNSQGNEFIKGGDALFQDRVGQNVSEGGDINKLMQFREEFAALKAQEADAKEAVKIAREELKAAKANMPKTKVLAEVDNSPSFKAPSEPKKGTSEEIRAYEDERGKLEKLGDSFIEEIQDEMVRVRRLVNNKSLKITDASNPYDAEIAFHGRVGTRLETLKETTEAIDQDIVKAAKKAGIKDEQFTKEVNEYLIARHAPERNAALEDGAAGITTADATARMAEFKKLPYAAELKRIADRVQKLNNETLDILKEGEVITDELYNILRTKYKNHVPLLRVMENEDDFAGALGKGFDVRGTGIRAAKGSNKEVADVLGNVAYNYEQALIRSEKNRVDLATLRMVRDNKEAFGDLFTVRSPRAVGETFDGTLLMEQVTDPKILVMREKGKVIFIEIKDAQLATALRGVGREKLSGMMRGVAAVTRFYSGVHTRFNPEFAFSNKIRDIQEVLVYSAAQGELGAKGALKVAGRELRLENEGAVLDFMRGKDSEGARLYKQMREDGGTTGGMGLSTRKQVELDMTAIRKLNRSNPRKAAQKTLEIIDNWNTIFEDSSRLSVYREALKNGASRQRAAVLAKESSVNFNKFGKQGAIINSLYMFANASIQGTTKMIRAMKNPKVAAAVTATVFGSVYAVSEWNDSVDPDWRNKITTWDRLNSLTIMLPSAEGKDVQYITIPVAWGIKPIKVMADEAVDLAAGKSDSLADAASSVLVAALEAYNPAGGSDVISAVTPTILDIPLDVARNRAWHGGPIRPDWDKNAPPSIQYFASLRDSSTGRTAVGISKGLSGVGMEVSPADIYYGYEQLIGGAGRAVNKTVNTIAALGQGTMPEAKDIPFVSRFYKTRPDEEVGTGAKEFETIATILGEQSRERFYLNQKAEDSYQQLKSLPKEAAARLFDEIKANDPELAREIAETKKNDDKGITFIDRKIIQLGVENGERAKFLYKKFSELESNEDKKNLWNEYKAKGIISQTVGEQLRYLLKNQGSTE